MSPAARPFPRGEGSTPTSSYDSLSVSTWASVDSTGSLTSPTAIGAISTYETAYAEYTTITYSNIIEIIPVAEVTEVVGSVPAPDSAGGSSHLALAIALPISLFVACSIVVALLLYRHKSKKDNQRRLQIWGRRVSWKPDDKDANTFDDSHTPNETKDVHPMSPISPVPRSYTRHGHERQDSNVVI